MAMDKNKILIAGFSLVIGFVIGFLVKGFVNNIILLIAGFGLGFVFSLWLMNKKQKKSRDSEVHSKAMRGIKK